jgi:hypothetical protein
MTNTVRSRAFVVVSLAVGATILPARVRAEPVTVKDSSIHESRPAKLDFTGSLGFLGDVDVGVAGWYSFPIMKDGFVPPWNDSLAIELGAALDYAWVDYGFGCTYNYRSVAPLGGVRWDLYLNRTWTVFAKAKAGIAYRSNTSDCSVLRSDTLSTVYPAFDGGAGAFWNFSEKMAMRMEFGYRGVSIGISINM